MSEFVHLHCHTEYSLLDGAIRLNDLCARAKDFGMPAAAITDHGNLYGAAYFYTTCKSYGIKPVIGCEVYVTKDHRDKDSEFSPCSQRQRKSGKLLQLFPWGRPRLLQKRRHGGLHLRAGHHGLKGPGRGPWQEQ